MKPNRFLPGLIAWIVLFSTACQPSGAARGIPLSVTEVNGQAEVQTGGKGDYTPLAGEVRAGDRLRVQSGGSVELHDPRALVLLGSGAEALVESLSADPAQTDIQLRLEKGSLYARADQSLAPGKLTVVTSSGSASLTGSGMIVNISGAETRVGCTDGAVTVSANGASQSLSAGQASSFMGSGIPSQPRTLDEELFGDDPLLMQVINDRWYHVAIVTATPYPTQPEPTARPSATITHTPAPTWTEMVLGPTATARVDSALPTRRPTATQDPDLKGLTPEEAANQGEHSYSVGCQAWGKCVCDSALAVPQISMTIAFDSSGVSLSASEGQLSYPRAAPNLYRIEQPDLLAEITFLPEGWELFVLKGGSACALQTYTRQ